MSSRLVLIPARKVSHFLLVFAFSFFRDKKEKGLTATVLLGRFLLVFLLLPPPPYFFSRLVAVEAVAVDVELG